MNTTPTRFTEIGMIVLAALLIIGGVFLIFTGKITFVEFSPFLVAVLGLFGINVAWKAPSPAQAQQLNTLADKAQVHDTQIQTQQQQLGHVQDLAVRATTTATQALAHVQEGALVQQQQPQQTPQQQQQDMVKLSTMPMTAMPATTPQFMQPAPQPVLYIDYGRHFGDSQMMPIPEMVTTQKIPAQ